MLFNAKYFINYITNISAHNYDMLKFRLYRFWLYRQLDKFHARNKRHYYLVVVLQVFSDSIYPA